MKKHLQLLLSLMATGIAFGVRAEEPEQQPIGVTGTSFQDWSQWVYTDPQYKYHGLFAAELGDATSYQKASNTNRFWYCNENAVGVITNSKTVYYTGPRPEIGGGYAANKDLDFLSLDTGAPVFRSIRPNNQTFAAEGVFDTVSVGATVYFDALVRFTASEIEPELDDQDKLVVWLYRSDRPIADAENPDGSLFGPASGLVVDAGWLDAGNHAFNRHYWVKNVEVDDGSWHRLTIQAIPDISRTGASLPAFVVYIDGTRLEYDTGVEAGDSKGAFGDLNSAALRHYTSAVHALFPSRITSGIYKATLAAAVFLGRGDVDDVCFTENAPTNASKKVFVDTARMFDLAWTEGVKSFTVKCGTMTFTTNNLSKSGTVALSLPVGFSLMATDVKYDTTRNYVSGWWAGYGCEVDAQNRAFLVTANGQGGKIVAEVGNRFKVDGKAYNTLDEILDEYGQSYVKIDLANDMATDLLDELQFYNEGSFTLDLCGHSLTSDDPYSPPIVIDLDATLQIIDSVGGGSICGCYEDSRIGNVAIFNEGSLTIGGDPSDRGVKISDSVIFTNTNGVPGHLPAETYVVQGVFFDEQLTGADKLDAFYLKESVASSSSLSYNGEKYARVSAAPAKMMLTVGWNLGEGLWSGNYMPVRRLDEGDAFDLPSGDAVQAPEGQELAGWLVGNDVVTAGEGISPGSSLYLTSVWRPLGSGSNVLFLRGVQVSVAELVNQVRAGDSFEMRGEVELALPACYERVQVGEGVFRVDINRVVVCDQLNEEVRSSTEEFAITIPAGKTFSQLWYALESRSSLCGGEWSRPIRWFRGCEDGPLAVSAPKPVGEKAAYYRLVVTDVDPDAEGD